MKDTLFPKFKFQNRQNLFHTLLGFLRYAIFISFYILSIRLIYISIDHPTIKHPLLFGTSIPRNSNPECLENIMEPISFFGSNPSYQRAATAGIHEAYSHAQPYICEHIFILASQKTILNKRRHFATDRNWSSR